MTANLAKKGNCATREAKATGRVCERFLEQGLEAAPGHSAQYFRLQWTTGATENSPFVVVAVGYSADGITLFPTSTDIVLVG